MAVLHILSHSPFADSRLSSCLRVLSKGDAVLLSGDAVYALQPASTTLLALQGMTAGVSLYALQEDLLARGLALPERAQAVDYPAFVQLCADYDKVNSWL